MFTFLLVVQAIVAACLVTVVLMQRSEGGGLGMGGSPGGFMSARGAADFLTRSTTVLAPMARYIFITGGVVSSSRQRSSWQQHWRGRALLQARGYRSACASSTPI
jgi:preprotein translocase subunit SecG